MGPEGSLPHSQKPAMCPCSYLKHIIYKQFYGSQPDAQYVNVLLYILKHISKQVWIFRRLEKTIIISVCKR